MSNTPKKKIKKKIIDPNRGVPEANLERKPIRLNNQMVQVGETYRLNTHVQKTDDYFAERQLEFEQQLQSKLADCEREAMERGNMIAKGIEEKAIQEADAVLTQAEEQAKTLIAEAEATHNQIKEDAYKLGYLDGHELGHHEATVAVVQSTVNVLMQAQTILNHTYDTQQKVMTHFQNDALTIIQQICKHVLQDELSQAPEKVIAMIDAHATRLHLKGKVRVLISEEGYTTIAGFQPDTNEALEAMSRFKFVVDSKLKAGEIYLLAGDEEEEQFFSVTPELQVDKLSDSIKGHIPLDTPEPTPPVPFETLLVDPPDRMIPDVNASEGIAKLEQAKTDEPLATEDHSNEIPPPQPIQTSTEAIQPLEHTGSAQSSINTPSNSQETAPDTEPSVAPDASAQSATVPQSFEFPAFDDSTLEQSINPINSVAKPSDDMLLANNPSLEPELQADLDTNLELDVETGSSSEEPNVSEFELPSFDTLNPSDDDELL